MVNLQGAHFDAKEWKDHLSFIPERFDHKSEYFLRPDGTKRNPLCFVPFLAGQRICLGKTFAEITLKYTLPMYCHFFSYEWVKEEDAIKRPQYSLVAMTPIEIMMRMKTKNKVQYEE